MKKVISDLPDDRYRGRRVLVRVDFNVPIDKGKIREDYRLRRAIPTIEYLCQRGAKVILASHLGKPKGNSGAGAVLETRRRSTQGDVEGSRGEVRRRGGWRAGEASARRHEARRGLCCWRICVLNGERKRMILSSRSTSPHSLNST